MVHSAPGALTAFARFLRIFVVITLLSGTSAAADSTSTAIVVHLQHFTDNLHAVKMALSFANALKKEGADVTLLLTLEGVRLADGNQPLTLVWGRVPKMAAKTNTIEDAYDSFVRAGGKVAVCPHCAAAAGCELKRLRPGAQFTDIDDMARLVLRSAKVVTY